LSGTVDTAKLSEIKGRIAALHDGVGGETPLDRAVLNTIERLVEVEPLAFHVQLETPEIVVYLLAGGVLHEIRGTKSASQPDATNAINQIVSTCTYHLRRPSTDSIYGCQIDLVENNNNSVIESVDECWTFHVPPGHDIKITAAKLPATEQYEFAFGLARAILDAGGDGA
jgi:hypothetical protein